MPRFQLIQSHLFFAILSGILACACGFPSARTSGTHIANTDVTGDYGEEVPYEKWEKQMTRSLTGFEKIEIESDWFDVYAVVPGVWAIHEPGHWESVLSYLVEGNDRAVLFDTGLGISTIKAVTDQLTSKKLTVLNSHAHYDHVGSNYLFPGVWARVVKFTREMAEGIPNSAAQEFFPEESFFRDPPAEFDRTRYAVKPWKVVRSLTDGEVIDLGGRSLEVVYTPGHSPDSICLLDRANRLLFTGDTFYLGPIYAQLEESNLPDYHRSAKRLVGLADDLEWIFPAHSAPTRDIQWLALFHDAFERIASGSAESHFVHEALWGKVRVYPNDGFWIMTPP
jgi:glyoxylase-like metal-dependent hydrolase (beta-lactamase superfamily II)